MTQKTTTEFLPLPKWHQVAGEAHDLASKVAGVSRIGGKFIHTLTKAVSPVVLKVLTATKILAGIGFLFLLPSLIKNFQASIVAKSAIDRAKSVAKTVLGAVDIVDGVADTIEGLQAVNILSKDSFTWAGMVAKVIYPFQFLSLAVSSYDLAMTAKLFVEIKKNLSTSKKPDLQSQMERLKKSCTYIVDNQKKLQGGLSIGAEAKIDERAKAVLSKLERGDEKAVSEGVDLLKTLKGRVTTKLSLSVLSLATKVAKVAAAGILLFVLATTPVVGVVFGVALVGLALFAIEKIALHKNPFAQAKDVWHEKAIHAIRQGIDKAAYAVAKAIKNIASAPKLAAAAA